MSDADYIGYNPDALQYLPGLNATFAGLDAETSAKVSQTLYAGLVTGTNPKDLVSPLVDCVSPARAEMIARTEMLGAYRSAALDAYRANSDVVGQWMWVADLIGACIACLEQDGSLHDLDEDMDGMTHPSCRCTAIPLTASWQDILGPLGIDASGIEETSLSAANFLTGDEWFAAQSAATQREIMGQAAWNAWQSGDLHIVDLVGEDGSVNSLKSLGLDFRDYLDRNMIDLDTAARMGEAVPETAAQKALADAQARVDELRAKWEADKAAQVARHLPLQGLYTDDTKSALWDLARAQAAVDEEAGGPGFIVMARDERDPFNGMDNMLSQLEQAFGRPFTRDDIAGLVGAPTGSYVEIYSDLRNVFSIDFYGPSWDPMNEFRSIRTTEYSGSRMLGKRGNSWIMDNVGIGIREDLQGQGLGIRIFADEVTNLSDLGVRYIETNAAGAGSGEIGAATTEGGNGYYTWPRFGYTGKLPEYSRSLIQEAIANGDLPESWGKYTTIQQLMRTPEGREWWKAFGEGFDGRFDLRDGSLSRRILDKYLQEKNQAAGGDILGLRGGASEPARRPLERLPDNRGVAAQLSDRYPNLSADFAGINADTANDAAQTFDQLAQRWPDAADRVQFFGIDIGPDAERLYGPGGLPGSMYAAADRNGTYLLLNTLDMADMDYMRAQLVADVASGFHTPGSASFEWVIAHEWGHVVDAWIRTDPERAALLDRFEADNEHLAAAFGRYERNSTNKPHEIFATAFASNELGTLPDDPYVKAQAAFLEQLLADHP